MNLRFTASLLAASWVATLPCAAEAFAQTSDHSKPGAVPVDAEPMSLADNPEATPANQIGEIVVTAQRRRENIQRVGIAISAISGQQLERANVVSPTQLPQFMSGVQLAQPNGTGSYSFSIRGVTQNDFADHEEPPTAIYVDGAYVSQMSGLAFQIFDLERVEILRGPQGTLFGRNATAGLAQFISKGPTNKLDGYARLSYGSYNDIQSEGAIGGPLVSSGNVQGRLSFATEDHDPIFHNSAGGPRLETGHSRAVRGQLLFKLPGDAKLLLIARKGDLNVDAGGFESVPAFAIASGPQAGYGQVGGATNVLGYPATGHFNDFNQTKGYARVHTYEGSAKLDVPLGSDINWSTLVDYQHLTKAYQEDSDTTPLEYFEFFNGNRVHQVSVDSHLSGDLGPLRWIAGVYYIHIGGSYYQGANGSLYGGLYDTYSLKTESYAAFTQLDYKVTDKLKLIGGIRYTRDKKSFDFIQNYPGYVFAFNKDTVGNLTHSNNGFWTGKAEVDYQAAPTVLAYASYNVGVKAGSFNAPLDAGPTPDYSTIPFKPERLTDYEVGVKSDLLNRHLRLNLAGFYYDYHDYQALRLVNLTQIVSNANARYYGGELEIQAVPDQRWLLGANLAYSNGIVKSIDLNGTGVRDYHPANAPLWSGNALIEHHSPLGSGQLSEQIDGNFVGTQYFALTNAPDTKQKAYALINARLTFSTGDKKWDFGASVENLANKHYATMIFDLAGFLGIAQIYPGRPRWWAATAAYHF